MRLANVMIHGQPQAVWVDEDGLVPLSAAPDFFRPGEPPDLDTLLQAGRMARVLATRIPKNAARLDPNEATWAPVVARPPTLWGVGLNFRAHAQDLGSDAVRRHSTGFARPSIAIAAPASTLPVPTTWGRVTGEAEIGVVLAATCRNASRKEAAQAVAGYAPLLDLTAEELLLQDTRYLGRAKAFPGSVICGPILVTPDEWAPKPETRIETHWNRSVARHGHVRDMLRDPIDLVSEISHVFPWRPGDLLQTGTPGAVPLSPGGRLGANVQGLPPLECTIGRAHEPANGDSAPQRLPTV